MRNFLIIKPSSFGDIIHGLQVVQSMKQQLGNVKIDWVAREMFAPFVQQAQCIDRVFTFYRQQGFFGFLRLVQELRKTHYDCIIDLQGLFRSGLLTGLCKGNLKIGRSDGRECSTAFYTKKIPLPPKNKPHALEILMELLPLVGCKKKLCDKLHFKEKVSSIKLQDSYVLMFPDSRRKEKEWPYFDQFTDYLLKNTPYNIVWAGQNKLHYTSKSEQFINLMGKTSIIDTIDLIKNAACVITNDSGPMHLAAAMHKKIIAFFGPTSIEEFGPYPINSNRHCFLSAKDKNIHTLSFVDNCNQLAAFLAKE